MEVCNVSCRVHEWQQIRVTAYSDYNNFSVGQSDRPTEVNLLYRAILWYMSQMPIKLSRKTEYLKNNHTNLRTTITPKSHWQEKSDVDSKN